MGTNVNVTAHNLEMENSAIKVMAFPQHTFTSPNLGVFHGLLQYTGLIVATADAMMLFRRLFSVAGLFL